MNTDEPIATVSKGSPASPSSVRQYLERHRQALLDMFSAPGASGLELARRHAQIMDGLLVMLHDAALAAVDPKQRRPSFVLGAVGGFGRQLLGWKSDLDVKFVTGGATEEIAETVDAMLYPLWDAGVSIGHQVVSISDAIEAAVLDLPTATALLDFRVIAGDRTVAQQLQEHAYAGVFSEAQLPRFLVQLEAEAEVRHRRLGDSVYLLEPDVKNGTGGLRDLDLALWAARARWKTSDTSALLRLGALAERDRHEVHAALEFLWTVRNRLHLRAGRRADRLTFAEQEAVGPALQDLPHASCWVEPVVAAPELRLVASVEAFMSDYYCHARNLTRISERILGCAKRRAQQPAPRERDLGGGLCETGGGVGLLEPGKLAIDPVLALRLYVVAIERDQRVLGRARDAIACAARDPEFGARLRDSREASFLFVQLVSSARRAQVRNGSIVSELHDVGLLTAMIPEFLPVVGRVHHDLYHVYTVDVHSVAAVDRLHGLLRGELAPEHPLACRLAAEVSRPHVLCLATLLHDIGKSIGGRNHSHRGADLARAILQRLGFSRDDNDAACQLIRTHLMLYLVAVRRDLEDPTTLAELAREVQSRAGLRDLYLLTVVDLYTTNPGSMTKWKCDMLDELFHASDAQLAGLPGTEPTRLSRLCAQFKARWASHDDALFLNEFVDGMSERYLRSTSTAEIMAHARVARELSGSIVRAALVPSRHLEIAELCVVAESTSESGVCVVSGDRPGLLASIAAAITAGRLEIHAAQAHSRQLPDGTVQVVDLFWVRSPDGPAGVRDALPKVQRDLEQVLSGRVSPRKLLERKAPSRWGERLVPLVLTDVIVEHRASAEHTVIEVVTRDRPGLLFTLAQALHELSISIAIAKISTEGASASDVFYVTERNGEKLDPGARTREVRERLVEVLGPPGAKA